MRIRTAAVALSMLLLVPDSYAQQQNPQILDVQAGCFLRIERANNVLVKVGPLVKGYRFTFVNTATQQTALDQTFAMINPGEIVPFQLPAAGTYQLTVRYAAGNPNQTAVTSPLLLAVKQVAQVVVNGQKTCQEKMPVPSSGGSQKR